MYSVKNTFIAALIILMTLIIEISTGINYVIFPVSIKELVNSNSLVGIAMSCEIISILIFCNLIDKVLHSLGLARSIIIASIIRTILLYLVKYINSYYMWILLIFSYGFITNVLRLSLQTWLNLLTFKKMKGFFLGLFSSALSLGVALGPVVLGYINIEREAQININAFLSFSVIILISFILKMAPVLTIKNKNRFIFVFKNITVIMISAVVGGVIFFGLPAFMTLYGLESGLKESEASLLLTSFMFGSVFLGMIISSLSSLVKNQYIIVFCVFNSLLCSILLPITIYNYNLSLLLLFIWGGNAGGLYAIGLSTIGIKFRSGDQVSANMAYSLMDAVGGLSGLCLIGVAMDLIGSEGLTYIIVASSISFFLYVLSKNKFH